jgi:hypothetical protein
LASEEHPALPDKDAAVQPPAPQIILEVGDRRHISGVARKHPRPYRQPIACEGQPHHHLGVAIAAFLIMAALAQRGDGTVLPRLTGLVFVIDLKVQGGSIPKDQVDICVEQIGGAKEQFLLEGLDMAQQKI